MHLEIKKDNKVYYIDTNSDFLEDVKQELGLQNLEHVIAMFKSSYLNNNVTTTLSGNWVTLNLDNKKIFSLYEIFQYVFMGSEVRVL